MFACQRHTKSTQTRTKYKNQYKPNWFVRWIQYQKRGAHTANHLKAPSNQTTQKYLHSPPRTRVRDAEKRIEQEKRNDRYFVRDVTCISESTASNWTNGERETEGETKQKMPGSIPINHEKITAEKSGSRFFSPRGYYNAISPTSIRLTVTRKTYERFIRAQGELESFTN